MIEKKESIDRARIRYAIQLAAEGQEDLMNEIAADVICITHKGKPVRCKSLGQNVYVRAIAQNDIVFGIGRQINRYTLYFYGHMCLIGK